MSALNHLGKGWDLPIRPHPSLGRLQYIEGPDAVEQSIRIILDTEPGERIMRPSFGCGLRRFLMKPNTVAIRALIKREVDGALSTWEPRIQLTSVEVTPGDDPALVDITIAYIHVRDRRPGNLVYPFYLE